LLSQAEAREDLIAEFDRMATDEIIEFASRRVASRVEEKTWLCYELTYFHELSSQEIAHQLGMNPPAVLMAVSRIRQMLRQEIRQLDPDHH
jgi:DNA-directed RNA polymerase specialized sigma24 family protein